MDTYSTRIFTRRYGWAHERNWLPRKVLQHPILETPYMIMYSAIGFIWLSIILGFSFLFAIPASLVPAIVGSLNFRQYFYKYPKYHTVLGLNDVRRR